MGLHFLSLWKSYYHERKIKTYPGPHLPVWHSRPPTARTNTSELLSLSTHPQSTPAGKRSQTPNGKEKDTSDFWRRVNEADHDFLLLNRRSFNGRHFGNLFSLLDDKKNFLLILGSTEGFRLQWGSLMPGRMGVNGYLMQNRHFTRRRGAHRCKQRHEQALPRPHSFSRSVYFLFWTTRFSQFAGIWGILLLSSIL